MPAYTDGCRIACALLLAAQSGQAYEDGAPPAHSGGFGEADCSACHADNRVNDRRGELLLGGLPAAIVPDTTYELSVSLRHPALEVAGLQMTMRQAGGQSAGRFEPSVDSGLAIQRAGDVDYLQHVEPARPGDDATMVSWDVRWRAPAVAAVLQVDIAANAANGDASALGDYVYRLSRQFATVRNSSPVPVQAGSDRSRRSGPAQVSGSAPAARSSNHESP